MALLDDDLDPRSKKPALKNLDNMSVAELKDYVAALKNEILRAEADMAKKEKSKAAADGFFKS